MGGSLVASFEGGFADDKLVSQDPETPYVYCVVIGDILASMLNHFRRQVVQGATHGCPSVAGRMNTPTKVSQLYCA